MHTLRSQQSKSTQSYSRRSEKLLPVATEAGAARIKAKNPSLISKPRSTTTSNQTTKDGTFTCKAPGCNFTTKYQSSLKRHANCHGQQTVSSPRTKPTRLTARKSCSVSRSASQNFKCNKCSYSTGHSGNLTKHFATHSQAQPFGCQYCEYRSRWSHNVNAHEKKQHSGLPSQISGQKKINKSSAVTVKEVVRTLEMNKVQPSKHQLDTLRVSSADNRESREGSFRCKDCDYVSMNKRQLISHREECHSDGREFPCTFPGCAYRSNLSQWARSHERRAHGFTRFQHLQQVKSKAQKQSTRTSKNSKSSNVQFAKVVQRQPTRKMPSKTGSVTVTRSKKIFTAASKEKAKCPKCYFKCYPYNLKAHLRVHSDDKLFGCIVKGCSYRTKWPYGIKTHMKSHGKVSEISPATAPPAGKSSHPQRKGGIKAIATPGTEKPFKCPHCDFRGKSNWHVRRHQRSMHKNIPPTRSPKFNWSSIKTRNGRNLAKHRLESHSDGPLPWPSSRPTLQLNSDDKGKACQFCGCNKKCHAIKNVERLPGRKKPLAVDQPEVDKELSSVNDDEDEKEILEEALMEPVVELADSTGFACMLCDFVGYSEGAALEHAQSHTRPAFPIDQLDEIPIICLD